VGREKASGMHGIRQDRLLRRSWRAGYRRVAVAAGEYVIGSVSGGWSTRGIPISRPGAPNRQESRASAIPGSTSLRPPEFPRDRCRRARDMAYW